jgi:hypothetical protein
MSQEKKSIRCINTLDLEKLQKFNPEIYKRVIDIEEHTQKIIAAQKKEGKGGRLVTDPSAIITIPVVVHVLHDGEAVGTGSNISVAQIQSQIDVLNEDFRRMNVDASNTPSMFSGSAADTKIQFALACRDPNGNSTNGIIRTEIPGTGTFDYEIISNIDGTINEVSTGIKTASTAWRSDWYLNIWVVGHMETLISNNMVEVFGYARFPGTVASQYDGVVIEHNCFGRTGTLHATLNKGRTATHEIGHWLNLRHIWGDSYCGNDLCSDTPQQQSESSGCITSRYSCSNDNMVMNFMDYTDDACMNMFTNDQRDRMRANISTGGSRASLISLASITGSSIFCSNTSFSVPSNSGTTFTWDVTGSATLVSGQGTNSITVSPSGSGSATISVRAQGLCISRTVHVGAPTVTGVKLNGTLTSNGYFCAGSLQHLEVVTTTASSYSWSVTSGSAGNNGFIYGPTNQITAEFNDYTAEYSTIQVQATNACGTTNSGISLISQNCFLKYVIFPNPAKNLLSVEFESLDALPYEVKLYSEKSTISVKNFLVQEMHLQNKLNNKKLEIEVSELPRGIYYLHVIKDKEKKGLFDSHRIILE